MWMGGDGGGWGPEGRGVMGEAAGVGHRDGQGTVGSGRVDVSAFLL